MIRLSNEPYLVINLVLAGVILLVFVYSAVFSPVKNDYPVICIHETITGEQCASCGLSHGFSLILRGEVSEALIWNPYSLRIFIFFFSQLLLRIAFSFFYLRYKEGKWLIIVDSVGSGSMFLIAFWPFLRWLILMIL